MPSQNQPFRNRVYQNHHFDSTRWDLVTPRDGDIVVATSLKAGTTWTQAIVANLLYPGKSFPAPVWQINQWVDYRGIPWEVVNEYLEMPLARRTMKTHLPLDGLRFFPDAKYIYVSRDGRDVALSLWNHYVNYSDLVYSEINDTPGLVGEKCPYPPEDFHAYWHDWCTRGWFDWEQDGYPFWSHLYNVQSWWPYRHLPNILFLHYADMKRDLTGSIGKIATFLGLDRDSEAIRAVAEEVSIESMRNDADNYVPDGGTSWKGGAKTFLHKGVNGRWKDILSPAELMLYDQACDRVLTPDCRNWLEFGGAV